MPPVQRITWEPWIFWVWNQISRRSASLLVVLTVAAAHQNPQARRGAELPWTGGPLEAGLLFAPAPEVAALRQLGTDVVEVLLQLRLLRRLPQRLHLQRMRCNFPAVL